ncbi:MAG TPA: DUF3857 domain-containing protein [Chitinophagaceae bacterium]|nr:DUF3857 domain-containing protein [Chitinophagaceae bacterium]
MNLQKRVTLSLIIFLASNLVQAQVQDFGKITKDDLAKKASLLDKSAEAEVLFETSETSLSILGGHFEITVKNHTRLKIFNEKGLDEANIKIPYIDRNHAEYIQKLEAQTYNLDEAGNIKVSKLDKKNVFDKRINNRLNEQVFSFPEVKAGSIIEYRYVVKRKLLYIDEWSFQRHIPVLYSSCSLQYPPEFMFTPVPRATLHIETNFKKNTMYDEQSYTMQNVPALKDEPFISSEQDYIQRIKFTLQGYFSQDVNIKLAKSWQEVIKELLEDVDFGEQLKKNIPRTQDLTNKIAGLKSPYEKMVVINDYVKQNMAWDGKTSIWALDGVKSAWEKKSGNSGEINLILVNLLKDAGLNANPVLVSTHDNGRIQTMDADLNQFNTVMAYVLIDSAMYVLDATDKKTPASLIPSSVVCTEGLVINNYDNTKLDDKDWGWRFLWNENKYYYKLINVSAGLTTGGKISGNAFVMNKDYARTDFLARNNPDSASMETAYKEMHANIALNELVSKNEKVDSLPFEHTFNFELPVEENGGYQIINVNLFTGLQKNPFLATERSSDIFFGYNQKYLIRGTYKIPEGYEFEELPKNVRMVNPDKTIDLTRIMQKNDKTVQYSITLDFKKPFYTVSEYADFAEFYKQLNTVLNEPIVVKKTSKP